jgi:hypothetical protein
MSTLPWLVIAGIVIFLAWWPTRSRTKAKRTTLSRVTSPAEPGAALLDGHDRFFAVQPRVAKPPRVACQRTVSTHGRSTTRARGPTSKQPAWASVGRV